MASVFRRRITSQIVPLLKPYVDKEEFKSIRATIPLSLKLNQLKSLPPQFEIEWKDIIKLKPQLQECIHPKSVFTCLKNQEFAASCGIKDVLVDPIKTDKFIFTVDQDIFTSSVLLDICSSLDKMPDRSTFFQSIVPEKIVFEYSSPNIAKPFHYGHFRSTVMGNFMSNLWQYIGHEVIRINYLGDWGVQYGILAAGFSKFGSEEELTNDPLGHLFEVYKKANELKVKSLEFENEAKAYFRKMEEGDNEALHLWKRLKDLSLREMNSTYERLHIHFDELEGESMYSQNVKDIYKTLLDKNIARMEEDGSLVATFTSDQSTSHTAVLQKSDGTSIYLARDIAAALHRRKTHRFDSMFYVVDSNQAKHFKQLKNILLAMGHSWADDINHMAFGRILNFSTRKGTVVFLHDIINEAKERAMERMKYSPNTKVEGSDMEEVSEALGLSALIINDFRSRRKRDARFEWERVLSMKADSGVSLQYCHARLNNIRENCGVDLCLDCETLSLVEPEAIALVCQLSKFDEAIYNAYIDQEPCVLVHYLFALKNEVSRAIKVLPVKGSNPYVSRARLLLFHSAYLVLKKAFHLFGITPLDKM